MEKAWMPILETSRAKVVRRLEREGWINVGGGKHDMFRHPRKPGAAIVPRHRQLTPGVARTIAKAAGWLGD
jgi:predicted RNA binding protein YcfA (HicA-like mRNA interferase family)